MDAYFVVAISTLLAIVDPIGVLPPFLAMMLGESREKQRQTAGRATLIAAVVLMGAALTGSFVFKFFGITLPALRIAGGILLFFVAFEMINVRPSRSKQTAEEQSEGVQRDDIAIFPLAIPLLAGPGSIISVFILSEQAGSWQKQVALHVAILLTLLTCYVVMREAHRAVRLLGQIGMHVLSRLMGLVLAAVAVQFVIDGVRGALDIGARP